MEGGAIVRGSPGLILLLLPTCCTRTAAAPSAAQRGCTCLGGLATCSLQPSAAPCCARCAVQGEEEVHDIIRDCVMSSSAPRAIAGALRTLGCISEEVRACRRGPMPQQQQRWNDAVPLDSQFPQHTPSLWAHLLHVLLGAASTVLLPALRPGGECQPCRPFPPHPLPRTPPTNPTPPHLPLPLPQVLWAALFALAVVVRDSSPHYVQHILTLAAAGVGPALREALVAYRQDVEAQVRGVFAEMACCLCCAVPWLRCSAGAEQYRHHPTHPSCTCQLRVRVLHPWALHTCMYVQVCRAGHTGGRDGPQSWTTTPSSPPTLHSPTPHTLNTPAAHMSTCPFLLPPHVRRARSRIR